MSAKSTPQILSIKNECSFYFSNFLIIGLCSSPADPRVGKSKECWFDIFSLLATPPDAVFFNKNFINH